MKFKPLLLLVAATGLLASCGTNNSSTPSSNPSQDPSSSQASSAQEAGPTYLTFVEKGKLRIDIFDVDVNFSYGNTALSQAVNTVDFAANTYVTVNKNSEIQKYYFVLFAEKGDRHSVKYLTPDGPELTEFLELGSVKNFFKDYVEDGRGYLAISTGEAAKWTKGLNVKLDQEIDTWTKM